MTLRNSEGSIRWPVIVALLLVALVVAGWWWQARREAAASPTFLTATVETGSVVQTVLATGQLNPVRTVQVGSQVSGNILELLVDFNSPVKKGQVVARLDPAIYQANVALASAEVESAAAGLALAQVQWERLNSLHDRAMVSDSQRDEARARLRQAEAAHEISRHLLEKTQLELERCTISSPVDGLVIARNVDVGQTVAASLSAPVLFEIAEDLTQMEINTYVSEADIGRVAEGQRVLFRVDAYRDDPFEGVVWQVRNAPLVMDNVVSYDAVVRVSNADLRLKPGMTAVVDFITAERTDIRRVRNSALRARLPEALRPSPVALPDEAGWRQVIRMRPDGMLEAVAVRLGVTDGMHTEILDGLAEGDVLVTGLTLPASNATRSGPSLLQGSQATF